MALANKFRGWLVLICGNKSELAVGYTTIYGVDMAGGFAVIKDVFKTKVYELAHARNESAGYDLIPDVGPGQAAVGRARHRGNATTRTFRRTSCSTRSSRRTSNAISHGPS